MLRFLIRWALSAMSAIVALAFVPGVHVTNGLILLIAALIIGLISALTLTRPILLLLTLPINRFTLGLFTLVVNVILFWFASSIAKGFSIADFKDVFLGALVYSLLVWFFYISYDNGWW